MHDLVPSELWETRWPESGIAGTEADFPALPKAPARRKAGPAAAALTRVVELEIIPRLLLAHRPASAARCASAPVTAPDVSEVAEITALILAHDITAATLYAEAILARGVSVETLSLDLLAPAARRMGAMWVDDACDFVAVSVGVWRLHQLMRNLSPDFRAPANAAQERQILITTLPGDQHSFGAAMVATFFRNAGWHVFSGPVDSQQELASIVHSRRFAVVALSLSCSTRLDALATTIRAVRRASRNPAVGVMVGGGLFNERPELVRLVGADATAADARSAPVQATSLVSLLGTKD